MNIKYLLVLLFFILAAGTFVYGNKYEVVKNNCQNLDKSEKPACWKQEFDSTLKNGNIERGFKLLSYLYQNDSDFASNCHDYTHLIGQEAYKTFAKNQKLDLDESLSYCGYGFYHGFIISLFKSGRQGIDASNFCDYVDRNFSKEVKTALLDCFHGIGHGTTDFDIEKISNFDDLNVVVESSIELCNEVTSDQIKVSRCVDGVYHSVLDGSISNEKIVNLFKNGGLFEFCNIQKSGYKDSCYQSSGFLMMYINNNDFSKSLKLAQAGTEKQYSSVLIRQMAGFEAYRNVGSNDLSSSFVGCKTLVNELKIECIKGLVEGATDFGNPGKEEYEISDLCSIDVLNSEEREQCLSHAASYFKVYFGSEKQSKLCNIIGESYCEDG